MEYILPTFSLTLQYVDADFCGLFGREDPRGVGVGTRYFVFILGLAAWCSRAWGAGL